MSAKDEAVFYVHIHHSVSFLVGSKQVMSHKMMEGEQI
jgi:hypothetical protein